MHTGPQLSHMCIAVMTSLHQADASVLKSHKAFANHPHCTHCSRFLFMLIAVHDLMYKTHITMVTCKHNHGHLRAWHSKVSVACCCKHWSSAFAWQHDIMPDPSCLVRLPRYVRLFFFLCRQCPHCCGGLWETTPSAPPGMRYTKTGVEPLWQLASLQ